MAYYNQEDMPKSWRILRFEEFLEKVSRRSFILDDKKYEICGVRWYGKGVFARETSFGRDIKKKDKYQLRFGDVVYNKLFAWKGAFAVVDAEMDGAWIVQGFFCNFCPVSL